MEGGGNRRQVLNFECRAALDRRVTKGFCTSDAGRHPVQGCCTSKGPDAAMSRASAGQKQPLSLKAESWTRVSGQAGGRSPASRSPRQALFRLRPEGAGREESRLPGAGARRWGVARRKAGRSTGEGLRSVPVGRVRGAPAPTPSESAPQTPVLAGKTSEPHLPPSRRLCLFLSCPARPRPHGCEVQGPRSAGGKKREGRL